MEADDLVLLSDRRASIKRSGRMEEIPGDVLPGEQLRALILPRLSVQQREDLAALHDVDFSYEVPGRELRFRAHVFNEMGGIAAVFRTIKNTLLDIDKAGFPEIVKSFQNFKDGLVLIGGPTGAGKSTTLAALIDYINRTYARHIITVEEPIEFVHNNKKSTISQREVPIHCPSFADGLRASLREDADIVLVGEMRDLETISLALTAAETGLLVFGTLHTNNARKTVDRLVDVFPSDQQSQVRTMLAGSLRGVVAQLLLRRCDSEGRVAVNEILVSTPAVSSVIREGSTQKLYDIITGGKEYGMQFMDDAIWQKMLAGQVSAVEAYMKAIDKSRFRAALPPEYAELGNSGGSATKD
jgi:twitching motility protein PilT